MDIKGKVTRGLGGLEKLVASIPGYKGYKEKEMRREADKLLRMHLARQFEEQRGRLSEVQAQLTEKRQLATVATLERAMMKLQLLIDRLKMASYGYAGWFDAVKVREEELDALYSFDNALADGVAQVAGAIDGLAAAATKDEDPAAMANDLVATLERINGTFSKRQDVILQAS